MHVDLVVRKEWIEREKVEFLFKKGRGEGNKGERRKGKGKINLLELLLGRLELPLYPPLPNIVRSCLHQLP